MRIKNLPVRVEKRYIETGKRKMKILILRPRNETDGLCPGVLWIHGGGYQSGSAKDVFATRGFTLAHRLGAVVVSPEYRLSKKHPYPAGLSDCRDALLYLKEHAEELGVRSDQIMVGGESAGGGLAAALCMLEHDRGEVNVAFQMPLYPMLDDRDTPSSKDNHAPNWNTKRNKKAWKRYLRDAVGTDIVSCYAAPARREDMSGLPPCYTYVGDIEPFYCETVDYVRRLCDAGTPAECDVYKGWFHAYDLFFPAKKTVKDAAARFEERFLYAKEHYFAPQK